MYTSKNPQKTFERATYALFCTLGYDVRPNVGNYTPEAEEKVSGIMEHLSHVSVYRNPAIMTKILTEAAETALLAGIEAEGSTPKGTYRIQIFEREYPFDSLLETPFVYKLADFSKLPGAVRFRKTADFPAVVEFIPSGIEAMETDEQALAYIRQYRDVLLAYGVNVKATR